MLVQKLNSTDLNSEKMTKFDGTMIYAQNKRQQVKITTSSELGLQFFKNLFYKKKVVLTEYYARKFPKIYFGSMHPGWSDTPGRVI